MDQKTEGGFFWDQKNTEGFSVKGSVEIDRGPGSGVEEPRGRKWRSE